MVTSVNQQQVVKGVITDPEGAPLPGVSVQIKNTNKGVVSNFDGSYQIEAPATAVLMFSYIGYGTQEITVGTQTRIDVVLQPELTDLGTVTINAGYYKVSRKESTGSIARITSKTIEQQPVSNPLASLQGRMAGVEITQTSGVPGASFEIRIRGRNSIRSNGNEPLYIIDGVPYASATLGDRQTSASIVPGIGFSPLNNISPSDIENIEILKDADATAIYGSRGANGVVLITTKKGKMGSTAFRINIATGFGKVANRIDLLDTAEYLAMRKEAYANDGIDPLPFNAYDVNGTWDTNRHTDWQEELFGKSAYLTNVEGSFSGGNRQTQFLISGNYNQQTTVFPGDFNNDKISVLSNVSHQSQDDKLALQFSANYTLNDNNLPAISLVREAVRLAPNAPDIYNADGSLNWENSTWNNPLRNLDSKYLANGSNLISHASINYKIYKGLEASASLGYTQSRLKELRTIPSTTFNPAYGLGSEFSSAIHNNANRDSWIIEPKLQWHAENTHTKVQTLVGLTFQEENSDRLSQFASGFTNNSFIKNLAAASSIFILGDTKAQYRYQALFGRINLNHRGKYILNLTGRRDGSSRFGSDKKFANFGAVGAAWIFSKEAFVAEALPFLSFGKLRGSYGTSGNDQIGDYQYLDTYAFGNAPYQNIVGIRPLRLYNPDFSWESNKKLELAIELGLWKDRISLNAGFYRNTSSNQLVGIPLPGTTGFSTLNANLDATVENKGWEFELRSVNINGDHFKWTTDFNLTIPKNTLLQFPDLEGSTYANTLVVGQPLNILKLYGANGVNPQTGLYGFTDFNGDSTISAPDDKQVVSDLNPRYYGGINNSMSYKRFKLDLLFQFTKQQGLDYLATNGITGAMLNQPKAVLERWKQAGDQTTVQRFTSGLNPEGLTAYINYTQSDAAVVDASYVRLKTLALSYTVCNKETNNLGCTLFLRGQNLWTLTDYNGLDPENRNSATVPPLRFITLGAQFTF
ncbi:TonB-dependent receptor [Snuella lapsa]|uniref:TonB-dependent receptor n=2 Tax=Snuella lapsa TaxID=870481 RepID=A0ABP6XWA3_9FLAO